jgi:hypothetical protein
MLNSSTSQKPISRRSWLFASSGFVSVIFSPVRAQQYQNLHSWGNFIGRRALVGYLR